MRGLCVSIVVAALLMAVPSAARAGKKDEMGCIGLDEFAEFAVLAGRVELSGTGVEDDGTGRTSFDREGSEIVLRAGICPIERFGAFMGWNLNIEYGGFTSEPVGGGGDDSEKPSHFDLHVGLHAIPYYKIFDGHGGARFDRKLAVLAGVGVNLDYAYPFVGLSVAKALKRESVALEATYVYVPAGLSYSQRAQVREHRPSAALLVDFTKSLRVAFGAEARIGTHARSDGDAPLSQALIGDYMVALGFVSLRMQGF
jgi:hypothetical protein